MLRSIVLGFILSVSCMAQVSTMTLQLRHINSSNISSKSLTVTIDNNREPYDGFFIDLIFIKEADKITSLAFQRCTAFGGILPVCEYVVLDTSESHVILTRAAANTKDKSHSIITYTLDFKNNTFLKTHHFTLHSSSNNLLYHDVSCESGTFNIIRK